MTEAENPTKDFYNEFAEKWAAQKTNSFYHQEQFERFITYLKEGDEILDIGCSSGIHVPLFLGIGRHLKYEGLDISESFLEISRSRYPQLSFLEGDLLKKETLPQKKYDAFWAAAVLMHVPESDWPLMMENIEGMMKPGALGYVTVPQERFADSEGDPRHFTLFTQESFRKIVESRGWQIVDQGFKGDTSSTSWLWFIVRLP